MVKGWVLTTENERVALSEEFQKSISKRSLSRSLQEISNITRPKIKISSFITKYTNADAINATDLDIDQPSMRRKQSRQKSSSSASTPHSNNQPKSESKENEDTQRSTTPPVRVNRSGTVQRIGDDPDEEIGELPPQRSISSPHLPTKRQSSGGLQHYEGSDDDAYLVVDKDVGSPQVCFTLYVQRLKL